MIDGETEERIIQRHVDVSGASPGAKRLWLGERTGRLQTPTHSNRSVQTGVIVSFRSQKNIVIKAEGSVAPLVQRAQVASSWGGLSLDLPCSLKTRLNIILGT